MLSSLFAVCGLATWTTVPGTPPTPIEAGIHVGTTQFSARNYTDCDQVLVFRASERAVLRLLPAGGEVEWSFPRHALADVELAVVSRRLGVSAHSGAFVLADAVALEIEDLWVVADGTQSIVWARTPLGFVRGATSGGSAASASGAPSTIHFENPPDIGPTHVPVITPSDTPQGDLPPKLEEKPLPPV